MKSRLNTFNYHSSHPIFEIYCEVKRMDGSKNKTWFSWFGSSIVIERNNQDLWIVSARTEKMCDIFNAVFGTDFLFNAEPMRDLHKVVKYMLKNNISLYPNVTIIED